MNHCVTVCVFPCSLSDQELFTGQFGGLDSGFNSVDSGSKRWSGNEVNTGRTHRLQYMLINTSHVLTLHVAAISD